MKIGYMRVSSEGDRQTTNLQRDALLQAGVDSRHFFEDKASGAKDKRLGLQNALDFLQKGDCLVVWKLDRLGRRSTPYDALNRQSLIENLHDDFIACEKI